MTLPDEMRRLTRHFLDAYDTRMEAVVGIQTTTEEELAEFHAARKDMAAEQQQQLSQYMSDLHVNVGGLRLGAQTFVKDIHAAHQAMAAEQREWLAEDRDRLASDTASLLQEFDAAHQAMTADQQQQLSQYMSDLHGNVGGLLLDAQTFVKDIHAAHQAMAAEQRERLAEDRDRLASNVVTMRERLDAERSELQAQLNEARRVWGSLTELMQQRRGRKPAAPPPPPPVEKVVAPPPVEEAPPPPAEEVTPDDLTTIRGIGASMQQRLNEAGVYTYAQLATSTPEELRRGLGTAGRLARAEEWIEQARELALG